MTLGKQKDRTNMKTKTKMSALKLAAFQLYNLLAGLYCRPVCLFIVIVHILKCMFTQWTKLKRITIKNVCQASCFVCMIVRKTLCVKKYNPAFCYKNLARKVATGSQNKAQCSKSVVSIFVVRADDSHLLAIYLQNKTFSISIHQAKVVDHFVMLLNILELSSRITLVI